MNKNNYQRVPASYRRRLDFQTFLMEREEQSAEGCFFNSAVFKHLKYPFDLPDLSLLEGINQTVPSDKRSMEAMHKLLGKEFFAKTSKRWYDEDDLIETQQFSKLNRKRPSEKKVKQNIDQTFLHVIEFIYSFRHLEVKKIKKLHRLLFQNDEIRSSFRDQPTSLQGTYYQPLKEEEEIEQAMEDMCEMVNAHHDPYSKSLLVALLLAYIQPFEDGNKRVASVLSNAVLLAEHKIPLLYEAVDLNAFRKAILMFYERNNILLAKEVFVDSYLKSSHLLRHMKL